MGGSTVHTKAEVIAACSRTRGLVNNLANNLGVSRNTASRYKARWKEVREALNEDRWRFREVAEDVLMNAVEEGEPWAIRYYLNNDGKEMGYGTNRHEVSGHVGTTEVTLSPEEEAKYRETLAELYGRAD